jgi:hypothetical protein
MSRCLTLALLALLHPPAHRHPETLQRNLLQLQEGMGLGQEQLAALLLRYPAALDMCPATVLDHLARLAELLELEPEQAAAVVSLGPALLPCLRSRRSRRSPATQLAPGPAIAARFPQAVAWLGA